MNEEVKNYIGVDEICTYEEKIIEIKKNFGDVRNKD